MKSLQFRHSFWIYNLFFVAADIRMHFFLSTTHEHTKRHDTVYWDKYKSVSCSYLQWLHFPALDLIVGAAYKFYLSWGCMFYSPKDVQGFFAYFYFILSQNTFIGIYNIFASKCWSHRCLNVEFSAKGLVDCGAFFLSLPTPRFSQSYHYFYFYQYQSISFLLNFT